MRRAFLCDVYELLEHAHVEALAHAQRSTDCLDLVFVANHMLYPHCLIHVVLLEAKHKVLEINSLVDLWLVTQRATKKTLELETRKLFLLCKAESSTSCKIF